LRSAGSLVLLLAALCSAPGSIALHAASRGLSVANRSGESQAAKAKMLFSRLSVERRNGAQSELRALLEDLLAASSDALIFPAPRPWPALARASVAPAPASPAHAPLFERPPPAFSLA
jgi:hypothetical protein